MRVKTLKEIRELITPLQYARGNSVLNYRGHGLRDYKLLPGLGRVNVDLEKLETIEGCLVDKFTKAVDQKKIEVIHKPFDDEIKNEWYILFQAQHLGLSTRLMDWSIKWETAVLFSVNDEKHHGKDGSFWIFHCPKKNTINYTNMDKITSSSLLNFESSAMINSPTYQSEGFQEITGERRMRRQSGRFWTQSLADCKVPLNEQLNYKDYLQEIIIDGGSKAALKEELSERGLTVDWNYFRNDDNIDKEIKKINNLCINK